MRVRCGRCQSEFEVTGPGRYSCPVCGTANEVRAAGGAPPTEDAMWAPPEPTPSSPSPRVSCPACSFGFIVGDIDLATCPNCSAEVPVRTDSDRGAAS